MTSLNIKGDHANVGERQPRGAKKWFAEARTKYALGRRGLTLLNDGRRFDIQREGRVVGSYRSTLNGLEFTLYDIDAGLDEVAYKFGAKVNLRYR